MSADTLIFIGLIVAALLAMVVIGQGLHSRFQWRGSTYGRTKPFSVKDAGKLLLLIGTNGRFGGGIFESDNDDRRKREDLGEFEARVEANLERLRRSHD